MKKEVLDSINAEKRSIKFTRLPDGRRLSLTEYGAPYGKPIFYFHGWPGSRIGGEVLDEPAKALGVRLISADRPGFGRSDPAPGRTLLSWIEDVLDLSDYLGVKKFAVLGVSGGGPYTYAAAYAIPERLTRVGVAAGLGPVSNKELYKQLSRMLKLASWSSLHAPHLMAANVWGLNFAAKHLSELLPFLRLAWKTSSDKKVFLQRNYRELMRRGTIESLRQGTRSAVEEWQLYAQPWGFNLEDIRIPVVIWHGTEDKSVPYVTAKFVKSQLPKAELHTYGNKGHYLLYEYGYEILQTLVND
ncbi:alpha/beta hydrolase [Candidatus Roizmanbacteria bacterium]|nr:alpha/beta hydrolase [Candidatus Roizmanbacteria bacterium]